MNDFSPSRLIARVPNGRSGACGAFHVEDDFRLWAKRKGISKQECEHQINCARGHGYEHLKASLRVYRDKHEAQTA